MTYVLLILLALAIWRWCIIGTPYIRFSGHDYEVWTRDFMGYDNLQGMYRSEENARARIEELKKNPPRIIK